MKTDNDDNSRKTNSKLKGVILDLFDQVRVLNARLTEKDRANAEKDRMSLTDGEARRGAREPAAADAWLGDLTRQGTPVEQGVRSDAENLADLNDIIKVLMRERFT